MSYQKQPFKSGEVAIIGAGPGDPDLLTMQAYKLITTAEIAIYDRLVSDAVLALLPVNCLKIYVGKMPGEHRITQDEINQLLVEKANKQQKVVRLKGGDPFVFGRGSEEILHLLAHNIPCHLVPGLTAASACTSYAGIPLTHRQISQSCTLITGNVKDNGELDLPWENLADKKQTITFYMGLTRVGIITEQLIAAGRDKQTPAALIYRGTQPEQQVYHGTLNELEQLVSTHKLTPPTLIVLGDVVTIFKPDQLKNLGYLAP